MVWYIIKPSVQGRIKFCDDVLIPLMAIKPRSNLVLLVAYYEYRLKLW